MLTNAERYSLNSLDGFDYVPFERLWMFIERFVLVFQSSMINISVRCGVVKLIMEWYTGVYCDTLWFMLASLIISLNLEVINTDFNIEKLRF